MRSKTLGVIVNVVFVTTWDDKGEQFNGKKIYDYLNRNGDESHMLVRFKSFKDDNIHLVGNPLTRFIDQIITAGIEKISALWAVLPISGTISVFLQKADIFHLEAIHGESFFSLLAIPILSKYKRVVWTIHDPWIMTGHCIYPLDCTRWKTGCGSCPYLGVPIKSLWDNTAFVWRLKHWIMHHSNVTLIVASHFMRDMVKQSPILQHLNCHVIPFGVAQNNYEKTKCREELSISNDAYVISFRQMSGNDPFKGTSYIQLAIKQLKNIHTLPISGWVKDHETIMKTLVASDIFLMPSIAESFGLMAIESMSVGTPVIVFEGTALPEIVRSGGVVVPRDSKGLYNMIQNLRSNPELYKRISENGKRIVKEHYTLDQYIHKHLAVYRGLIQ